MGAAVSFQAAFNGRVEQDEFCQIVDLQTGIAGSVVQIFWRQLVTRRSKSQTFVFSGLNQTNAMGTTSQTVTDYEGTSFEVPMSSSITDGSSGTKSFEKESVQVTRRRVSPGLWDVIVKRTGSEYYLNNEKIISGPAWAFG